MNPESFFSLDLSCQTNVAEICRRLVGNGRYTQEHARFVAYLRILRKAIFENFIRIYGSSACLILIMVSVVNTSVSFKIMFL